MRNAYSAEAVRRAVKASDSRDFKVNLDQDRHAIVEAAVAAAAADPSPLATSETVKVKQKDCHFYSDYATNLVLRATTQYLSQRFRITVPNRDRVVRSVIESVCEGSPFHVIRRDITSFYENLPTAELRDRLLFDTALPKQLRRHLRAYFELAVDPDKGLPRGIGLTTILAELAMHGFDQRVRTIPSVYKYFRYSDDILVFCTGDRKQVEDAIADALPKTMSFNTLKCEHASFYPDSGKEACGFDYLGYRFDAPTAVPKKGRPRQCDVSISDIKIKKIKTRLVLALKSFRAGRHGLLIHRLRYLSGNYRISRMPGYYELRSSFTRSGIYYNYKRCGRHLGSKFEQTDRTELMELDWFYHNLLFSNKSQFATKIATFFPSAHLNQIRRLSFNKGHTDKMQVHIPHGMGGLIKSIWRNH